MAPKPPTAAQLRRWWASGEFGKHRLRPLVVTAPDPATGSVTWSGTIVDPNGAEVGNWERSVTCEDATIRVTHNRMALDEEFQNSGFGRGWYTDSEAKYLADGVAQVDIHAEDVGGYVWATCGFDFFEYHWQDGDEVRQRALKASDLLESRAEELEELAVTGWVTDDDIDVFRESFADGEALRARAPVGGVAQDVTSIVAGKFTSARDIAAFGRGQAWDAGDYGHMWLGKDFMIGTTWLGRRTLGQAAAP